MIWTISFRTFLWNSRQERLEIDSEICRLKERAQSSSFLLTRKELSSVLSRISSVTYLCCVARLEVWGEPSIPSSFLLFTVHWYYDLTAVRSDRRQIILLETCTWFRGVFVSWIMLVAVQNMNLVRWPFRGLFWRYLEQRTDIFWGCKQDWTVWRPCVEKTSDEMSCLLSNPKVHCHVQKMPLLVPFTV